MSEPPPNPLPDDLSDFRIEAILGEGAMGVVYRAHQKSLDRAVALKILRPELARDATFIERLAREARAAASLEHLHLVRAFAVGEEAGIHYIAMDLVEGRTAADEAHGGGIGAERAKEVGVAVAKALAYAHERGLVHRDVKPSNVLLGDDGTIKLTDLGLSKRAVESDETLSRPGTTLGTPAYMAPEQIRDASRVGAPTDVYALAATLVGLYTGQAPFRGESLLELLAAKESGPPDLREVAEPVATTLRAALDPSPDARPTAAEMALRLDVGEGVSRPDRTRPRRGPVVLALVLLFSAGLGLWMFGDRGVEPTPAMAPSQASTGTDSRVDDPVSGRGPVGTTEGRPSVVVLPFRNQSTKPDDAYFAAGIREDVRSRLLEIPGLVVWAPESTARAIELGVEVRAVRPGLGATHAIEGSVQRSGDRVRIVAKLIDLRTGTQTWSETYDRDVQDIFAVQSEVASAVADAMNLEFSPDEAQSARRGTENLNAWKAWSRAAAQGGMNWRTIEALRQAVRLDPGFANAHARLALELMALGEVGPEALNSARRAIEAGGKDFRRGQEVMALLLSYQGKRAEAAPYLERARRDGASPFAAVAWGMILAAEGRLTEAAVRLRQAYHGVGQTEAAFMLATVLFQLGELEEAQSVVDRLVAESPTHRPAQGLAVLADLLRGDRFAALERLRDQATWGAPHHPMILSAPELLLASGDAEAADRWLREPEQMERLGSREFWLRRALLSFQKRWGELAALFEVVTARDETPKIMRDFLTAEVRRARAEEALARGDHATFRAESEAEIALREDFLATTREASIAAAAFRPLVRNALAIALLRVDRRADAKRVLQDQLGALPPGPLSPDLDPGGADFFRGLAYAMSGDTDRAVAALERARRYGSAGLQQYQLHDVLEDTQGVYGGLPDDSRFRTMLERTAEEERALRERIREELPELQDPSLFAAAPGRICRDVEPAPAWACRSPMGEALLPDGARSFADVVLRAETDGAVAAATEERLDGRHAIGEPDCSPMAFKCPTAISIGEKGIIELGFGDNILTNSGDARPDLFVFEVGGAEAVFVGIRPADPETRRAVEATCLRTDGDFCESHASAHWAIDIDGFFPGFEEGALRFDAVRLRGDPERSRGVDGADIDAVAGIEWR